MAKSCQIYENTWEIPYNTYQVQSPLPSTFCPSSCCIMLYHTVPVCTHFLLDMVEVHLHFMTWFHLAGHYYVIYEHLFKLFIACWCFFCILCPPKAMQSQESDGPSSPGLEVTWELVRVFDEEISYIYIHEYSSCLQEGEEIERSYMLWVTAKNIGRDWFRSCLLVTKGKSVWGNGTTPTGIRLKKTWT